MCPYHDAQYDPVVAYEQRGAYRPQWKILEGLYDEHGLYDEETCDMFMEMKSGWVDSLSHYNRIRHNPTALMVYMGILIAPSKAPGKERMSKEEIRAAVELHTVVEIYAELRQVGTYKYQARCPFHEDRLASLSINDEKGLWYCFAGCGGGDVFSFIMKAEKCDFRSALERAERYV